MQPRAIAALGIAQCVNWGVLYYAYAALVLPLERELGVPTWMVTGAFSLALLTSAALAPAVGRWSDRDGGALVMRIGGLTAAVLLVAWTLLPGVLTLYLVWGGIGLCMAASLYEPAFVMIGRTYEDPMRRLRALATVTLFGGLASTIFLPGTAYLVASLGWRAAVLVLAAVLVVSTFITHAVVLRNLPERRKSSAPPSELPNSSIALPPYVFIAMVFTFVSLASSAFTTNLIPALGERGVSPEKAAVLGGLMGVMQLPGRALLMNGLLAGRPMRLLAVSLVLQAAGFAGIAFAQSVLFVAGGTILFALGAGMTTLVRPHLIQTMFSTGSGYLNGRIARRQQLARATGPIAVAWLAGLIGYGAVFAMIAGVFAVAAVAAPGVAGDTGPPGARSARLPAILRRYRPIRS